MISGAVASKVFVTVRLEVLALATSSLNVMGLGAAACAASTEVVLVKSTMARATAVTVVRFIRFTSTFKKSPVCRFPLQIQREANLKLATAGLVPYRPPLYGAAMRVQISGSIEIKKSDDVAH